MARFQFWFHDKDKNGQPLDANMLKAAEEIAPSLTRYRQQEIDCEATSNDILQEAVEAASNATRRNRIANPAGYLASIYRRFVDKSIEQNKKLIAVDDEFIEDLANAERAPSFEEYMHNRLILEQVLELMDPDTRQICRWRLEGYSESQIAKRLGTTSNAVSVRFTRGFKEAAKRLSRGKRSSKRK
jgi:RNA polymerase sigma factor (sigma-70 family)